MAFNNDVVFAEFVHPSKGTLCSEIGFMDLSTEQECIGAVNYAKSFNSKAIYYKAIDVEFITKGCIINDEGTIFFNKHSTGLKTSSYTSICRNGNT